MFSSTSTSARPGKSLSLRANFVATFAGNAVFAATQWAILSLIAKLGDAEMLGQYALAVAIVTPVAMFSHLNLRAVLATDVEQRHPFGDYLAVRLATTVAGLAAVFGLALAFGYSWRVTTAILMVGLALNIDNVSDIYYGVLQRRERMDQIARSMIARGLLSSAALGAALWLTHNLLVAVAALALGRVLVLIAYDRRVASAGESLSRTGVRTEAHIFRTALPLGIVLALISLTANLPRYAIERQLGTAELGGFAAVASFMSVGATVVNALGQAATPRLARYYSERQRARFRNLTLELATVACLLGGAGVVAAAVLGPWVLRLVYRPAYVAYAGLLIWIMAASVFNYIGVTLGYVITSARAFKVQVPLVAASAGTSGIVSWLLVPRMGLNGAAVALAAAASIQISGELIILRRAMRGLESA